MCKVIAFTNMKEIDLKASVNDIGNTLLKTERDGFGYAVQGDKCVFGEKFIGKQFKSRIHAKNAVKLPVVKKLYGEFGVPCELTGAGIFHGRTSTNGDGLINTHPMQRPESLGMWHLIHNGVVSDLGDAYSKLTDNDSEDVLFRLMEGISHVEAGLSDNPMQSIEDNLEGYYAFACIDPGGRLHVARDGYATLYMAWSDLYETYIFATTESLLMKVNKMLDAEIGPIDEVEDDVYMIFEGNELVYHQFITPLGFTATQSSKAITSLGREIEEVKSNLTADRSGISLSGYRSDGGEMIVRQSDSHHRPIQDGTAEDRWMSEAQLNAILERITTEKEMEDDGTIDSERLDEDEVAYYAYRREVDNLDASYTITDEDGIYMKPYEFKKLDHIAQEKCTIIRPDGTVVLVDEDIRGYGRLA